MKRLVLSFDGTWNTPRSDEGDASKETNVRKLHDSVLTEDAAGIAQLAWYDEGVGTHWYDRIAGGMTGVGLSRNIRQGYQHLASHYQDGDEIFLLGFSRGAYTARSVAGLIRNCGILENPDAALVQEAYQIYRTRNDGADSPQARTFRAAFAHPVRPRIKCLGVWDTVGALGVPLQSFDFFNRHFYEFHDTRLSDRVQNAFQALAIDEHRREYEATLWQPNAHVNQRLEQVWFPGAHSNIGGGYRDDVLADLPLAWMMERVSSCGLALDPAKRPVLGDAHWTQSLKDSFAEFMGGVYRFFSDRHYRPVGGSAFGCEWLDSSALERHRRLEYQPRNPLGAHLGTDLVTPETLRELAGGTVYHLLQKLGM